MKFNINSLKPETMTYSDFKDIIQLIKEEKHIYAIKKWKDDTGWGLIESKNACDNLREKMKKNVTVYERFMNWATTKKVKPIVQKSRRIITLNIESSRVRIQLDTKFEQPFYVREGFFIIHCTDPAMPIAGYRSSDISFFEVTEECD
jgi:hypothetical protein